MKCIIYKQYKGAKPKIWAKEKDLKTAKETLTKIYYDTIENFEEEIIVGRDKLSKDRKELNIFNYRFHIEADQTL